MDKDAARKAEREKRQARIRNSGSSRLAKITGAAGTQDYKDPIAPQKAVSERLIQPSDSSTGEHDNSRGDPLMEFLQNAKDPGHPLFSALGNQTQQLNHLNQQELQSQLKSADPNINQSTKRQAQQRIPQRSKFRYSWDVLHFVLSITLGLYGALVNPWLVPRIFVALQIVLWSCTTALGHQKPGLPKIITPFVSMLSPTRQRQVHIVSSIVAAVRVAYTNMAIVLFAYGLASRGGAEFAKPIQL